MLDQLIRNYADCCIAWFLGVSGVKFVTGLDRLGKWGYDQFNIVHFAD
jgi:hypothetical protein